MVVMLSATLLTSEIVRGLADMADKQEFVDNPPRWQDHIGKFKEELRREPTEKELSLFRRVFTEDVQATAQDFATDLENEDGSWR